MTKCLAIDRNNNGCRCNALNESRFCKNHSYMSEYTDEMLSQLSICSGCKKSYYLHEGVKTCTNCKERGKQSKIVAKETVVLCASDKCKFKRSTENQYCLKHQLCVFIDETAALGKKLCKQYVRGCRAQLDTDYSKSACEECLVIEREKDRARRGYAQKTTAPEPNKQICTTCCKTLDEEQFVGYNAERTKTCASCREANRIQDMKRDKEHRNELSRIAEQKPERKAVKQEWNENNYEKVVMKGLNYRQRLIEADVDQYLNKNAENAKQWRENNPEKVANNNLNKINDVQLQYGVYARSARDKNLVFSLSVEEFDIIVKNPCCYCGTIQEKGFNGVDRQNSEIGYIMENCVSCCQMCNYMKASLSVDAFLGRVEHILTYNGRINGRLFPEMFPDYMSASYNRYKNRAFDKNLEFTLSCDDFDELKSQSCYLCGKFNNSQHLNGVDRLDNNKGYTLDNVKPCCSGCNYMKKNYILEDVVTKFMDIYSNIIQKRVLQPDNIVKQLVVELVEQIEECIANEASMNTDLQLQTSINKKKRSVVRNKIKKTEQEIREEARIRKQQHRLRLKETYGNEEYKKMRTTEMINYRKVRSDNKEITDNPNENHIKESKQIDNALIIETPTVAKYKPSTVNNKDIVANKNKKTHEEKREEARLKKQRQRAELKEKYGDEEYKKARAMEIAAYRKKCKEI